MRLTDTLVDLCCAGLRARELKRGTMQDHIVAWLGSADIDAVRLRKMWRERIDLHVAIFSSAIGESEGDTLGKRACQESFDFLTMLDLVVGVTGEPPPVSRRLHSLRE